MAHIDPQTGVMGSAIKFPHETGGEMYWSTTPTPEPPSRG
jgi:hypothetical protein